MLVLSRKAQESVVVADCDGHSCLVKVTIVEIRGERVRLGFDAKTEVPVHRWEVWQRMAGERGPVSATCYSDSRILDVDLPNERMNQRRLRRGDLVRVTGGAFAGVEGTVSRCQACRVTVEIPLIQSGVSIELDDHLVELIAERNGVAPLERLIG
jgi:carbon storage regulator